MSYYCRKCPRIIEEDTEDLCPNCASGGYGRYRWAENIGNQWVLSDENGYEASIGRWGTPNVQFVNEAPDIEVVLLVADKIRELGWDKITEAEEKHDVESNH